jgi:hypothetical protein
MQSCTFISPRDASSLLIKEADNRISLAVLQTLTFSAVGENPTKRSTHKTVVDGSTRFVGAHFCSLS